MDNNGAPPNEWLRNGLPLTNDEGRAIRLPQRVRVFLPVCSDCNAQLAKRFEEPAIEIVTRIATNRWRGQLTGAEWQVVGLWWAKIGLMLGNRAARFDHRKINDSVPRFEGHQPDYAWMVNNSPAPTDLSVFVHHASMSPGTTVATLGVPETVDMADGSTRHSHVFQVTTPELAVSVVSHPGMTIDHPLVARGEAWELLRAAPNIGDLAHLPMRGHRTVVFRQGIRAREGFLIDSSETSRLMSILAHEPEQVPELYGVRTGRSTGTCRRKQLLHRIVSYLRGAE